MLARRTRGRLPAAQHPHIPSPICRPVIHCGHGDACGRRGAFSRRLFEVVPNRAPGRRPGLVRSCFLRRLGCVGPRHLGEAAHISQLVSLRRLCDAGLAGLHPPRLVPIRPAISGPGQDNPRTRLSWRGVHPWRNLRRSTCAVVLQEARAACQPLRVRLRPPRPARRALSGMRQANRVPLLTP